MVKQTPKMTALVVSAIRNLREVQGSTPKEILNYIASEYNATNPTNDANIQRKLCTALKRGLEYGILKRVHGHYSLNTDPDTIATSPEDTLMMPMEKSCGAPMKRRRKARARASGGKGCGGGRKSRSSRRTRKSGGTKKSRRRRGGKRGGGSCGPSGRRGRSRKGRSRKGGKGRSRRSRKGKSAASCGGGGGGKRRSRRAPRKSRRAKSDCAQRKMGDDIDMLVKEPVETRNRENVGYDRERERSHSRGRQIASRSHSRSRSRSSDSSDREGIEENRRERQGE